MTIVAAVLAATVASANAAPNFVKPTRGASVLSNSKTFDPKTVAQSSRSERAVNVRGAVRVPERSAAASGVAAFTSARNAVEAAPAAGARPVARPAKVLTANRSAPRVVKSWAARRGGRSVASAAGAASVQAPPAKRLSARALARKSTTVALTREAPVEVVERPGAKIVATAPTGSIPSMVTAAAKAAGVNPALAHAVVKVESMYKPQATGKGGFIGLMQLSYRTAQGMGFRGSRQALYEPSANLRYGMRYLAEAVRKAGGDTCGAVSKYQGGHGVKGVTRAGAVYCAKVRRFMAAG